MTTSLPGRSAGVGRCVEVARVVAIIVMIRLALLYLAGRRCRRRDRGLELEKEVSFRHFGIFLPKVTSHPSCGIIRVLAYIPGCLEGNSSWINFISKFRVRCGGSSSSSFWDGSCGASWRHLSL